MSPIDESRVTRFGLLRHAPTAWNAAGRIQGQTDTPLLPESSKRVRRWSARLAGEQFHRIMVSDLERARATAGILNERLHLPVWVEPRLREQHWGDWEGMTQKALAQAGLLDPPPSGWDFQPPHGESRRDLLKRAQAALVEAAAERPDEYILVVSHSGVIKALLYHLCGRNFLPHDPPLIQSGHLHRIAVRGGELTLGAVNALNLEPAGAP